MELAIGTAVSRSGESILSHYTWRMNAAASEPIPAKVKPLTRRGLH